MEQSHGTVSLVTPVLSFPGMQLLLFPRELGAASSCEAERSLQRLYCNHTTCYCVKITHTCTAPKHQLHTTTGRRESASSIHWQQEWNVKRSLHSEEVIHMKCFLQWWDAIEGLYTWKLHHSVYNVFLKGSLQYMLASSDHTVWWKHHCYLCVIVMRTAEDSLHELAGPFLLCSWFSREPQFVFSAHDFKFMNAE